MNKVEIKAYKHRSCLLSNQLVENNSFFSKTNYLPWILGGVGIVALIGIVVYFATRKGENK